MYKEAQHAGNHSHALKESRHLEYEKTCSAPKHKVNGRLGSQRNFLVPTRAGRKRVGQKGDEEAEGKSLSCRSLCLLVRCCCFVVEHNPR